MIHVWRRGILPAMLAKLHTFSLLGIEAFCRAEDRIRAIHGGKVVDGDHVEIEAKLPEPQHEIEFQLGGDYFERRDRLESVSKPYHHDHLPCQGRA